MRIPFTAAQAFERGITKSELEWGTRKGRWTRAGRGTYVEGPEPATRLERAVAGVQRSDRPARGRLAGVLHELDSVLYVREPRRRELILPGHIVEVSGILCADALLTLVDLAATLDDDTWEQAFESAVRKDLVTVEDMNAVLPELARMRVHGVGRIRRVLARRPPAAPATGSLLETLMVQLIRTVPNVDDPVRQFEVRNRYDEFVAFVDLSDPTLGYFFELDGQGHKGQPVYDAFRETAVVRATGWLCGRFTWYEVTKLRVTTARSVSDLVEQARRRPFPKSA